MHIRTATAADVGKLAALTMPVHQMHVDAHPDIFKPLSVDDPYLLAAYQEMVVDHDVIIFIAEIENEPVGYLVARFKHYADNIFIHTHTTLYIEQISVAPDARGQGCGKGLMQALLSLAKERQVSRVTLDVWAFNSNAREFFASQGFIVNHSRMEHPLD
ncbi:MAG: hypothetical protein CL607_23515 [Anaerolineaceae bacterium]|nr:hypothetical protein [Anaerolineaceae bacterium]